MTVSMKTKIMLWGRSAHRCNFEECRRELFIDVDSADDPSVVGEICHMVAEKPDGPRGESPLTPEQRDKYSNLILLCNLHHKVVDDNPEKYTVDFLKNLKRTHERWVEESLQTYDFRKQRDEELYASYIDEWVNRVELNLWNRWSYGVMSQGQPSMSVTRFEQLTDASRWLFSRIWPKRYPELELAFENFLHVLTDLLEVFRSQAEKWHDDDLMTRKFYKSDWVEQERYDRLLMQYEFHVDLVMDLMLELTRAANYVCDYIRISIDPTFRLREGLVIAISGPDMFLRDTRYRTEYRGNERTLRPYPGLAKFKVERKDRDFHFGVGANIDDPNCQIAGHKGLDFDLPE